MTLIIPTKSLTEADYCPKIAEHAILPNPTILGNKVNKLSQI